MAARRLAGSPEAADVARPPVVTFRFDGREIRAPHGEPLAVALLAADHPVISRSFRFHRPRALMCSTGQCGWCECEVDGRPSVRSCQVPVRQGLVARSEHAWPSVGRDMFGLLDLGSRWIPPTFYHHRFLRPAALRKRYLDVLRAFGGRGRLPIGRPLRAHPRVERALEVEVLVVGGGRAGVVAADEAAAGGARVALVESVAGRARPTRDGVQVLDGATALGWYDGEVSAIDGAALWSIKAGEVVAATGSYERVPSVRGADRPGVMGARRAVDLIERLRVLPGERPLLVGDEAGLAPVRRAFESVGVAPVRSVSTADLRRILGRRGVNGAIITVGGRAQRESADFVAFSDRTPNLDLVLAAGAAVTTRGGVVVPALDEAGRTSVPRLRVVGSATGAAVPAAPPAHVHGRTLACFCEDVHVDEITAQVRAGYGDPELVKRRTGALTGPCQGKYCLQAFTCALAAAGVATTDLPSARPPLRPVRLGDLVPGDES